MDLVARDEEGVREGHRQDQHDGSRGEGDEHHEGHSATTNGHRCTGRPACVARIVLTSTASATTPTIRATGPSVDITASRRNLHDPR